VSKEFIEAGLNQSSINKAARQESHLSYFTKGELQETELSTQYLRQWADRKFQTNDYFLNWVKHIFKTKHFLTFFKYLRNPIPSAKLINNKIKPHLNRVFVAEDSDFKYDITGLTLSEINDILDTKHFENELFDKLLFKHNSIVITDLSSEEVNEPYRYFINVKDVISLDYSRKRITRIAFKACINTEAVIIYIDDKVYSVYNEKHELIGEVPHDLGRCPADFISKNKYKDDFVVRESIFTYIREELEEYVFLKTLLKMTEPNGAIPVTTKVNAEEEDTENKSKDSDGEPGEPSSDNMMGSQKAKYKGDNYNESSGDLLPGSLYEVPADVIMDDDGKINMDAVKYYINFFHIPVDILNYIKGRITEIENSIISTVIGTIDTSNEESKNEMQIEKSVIVLENTLIYLADNLNVIRKESDYNVLGLKLGTQKINEIFIFYGTDFFLESQKSLFEDLEKASNPIERKNILVRINQNRYKNNRDQMARQKLLYDLLPYTSDEDFNTALGAGIDPITREYQLRFNYWIGIFEAEYGDIVTFYSELDAENAQKLKVINDLIIEIIKRNTVQQTEVNINQNTN
jgi:hypothetical protein